MLCVKFGGAAALAAVLASGVCVGQMTRDYPIRAVPFTEVKVDDAFWSPRLETNRAVSIPYALKLCEETGRIENFDTAARALAARRGDEAGGDSDLRMKGFFFNDSDVYKVIEGAAYSLMIHPDAELERKCDEIIAKIAAAQEPDGYLYTSRTIMDPANPPPGGKERWSNIKDGHELYCLGHLFEAAVAYEQATDKRALLDVAIKAADLTVDVFGPGKNTHPCGHPEVEIALVKLYRATGDSRYLELAKFFIDARGRADGRALYGEHAQDHKPLVEQSEAVGHAVRAAYVYSGMADVAAMMGEQKYIDAIERLWDDVVRSKLYITGGIGSRPDTEGFAGGWQLPNVGAYAETCAAIANVFWNQRMFLLTGDAKYVDVLERTLYNGLLSGVALSGDRFFYPNVLESIHGAERSAWFACACCPSNVVRFLPSVPGYVYASREKTLYVNLFIGGEARVLLAGGEVTVKQKSRYPWDGDVQITVGPDKPREFELRVRVPAWARGQVVPSDLYEFNERITLAPRMTVNGQVTAIKLDHGYAVLSREWKPGDTVRLMLPMPVRRVRANPVVAENLNKVAFQRGPLVYCFEGVDHKRSEVGALVLSDESPVGEQFRKDLLGGVMTLVGRAWLTQRTLGGNVEGIEEVEATAIPYFAWANRGKSPMTVWVAKTVAGARALPAKTVARTARALSSFGDDLAALSDQIDPKASFDPESTHVHWWPRKGTAEWVQYDFRAPACVSGVEVYWFDDTGRGQCRVPKSWRLKAKVNGEWREVGVTSERGVAADQYNVCRFDPVDAEALRIEVQSHDGWSGGIHEWKVIACDPELAATAVAKAPLPTRWTADVRRDAVPLPEYPRPQMVRDEWVNLNGVWQWREARPLEPPPFGQDLDRGILVPFPFESALSGVMESVGRVWYRRLFATPANLGNRRLLLHFGAVNWEATVYVNEQRVGQHFGGYDAFSCDITEALKPDGPQELIVDVANPIDAGDQPRGKQVRSPEGIWYAACTGIWQTVWLEPVPVEHIENVAIIPLLDEQAVTVRITAAGDLTGVSAGVVVRFEGREVGSGHGALDEPITVKLSEAHAWSPDSPVLYELHASLNRQGRAEHVRSYFGLRKVEIAKDDNGVNRIFLNNRPIFLVGPLDQGYWPDGIYTAPTDEALRYDIEMTKRLGFNMTRKHVKVEPARWYYWADKLGLLVWQDMPSGNNKTEQGRKHFEWELRRMIETHRNHPSIMMWVVFNEGWGQFDTQRVTEWVKAFDLTRLVNNASGWTDAKCGDVIDIHSYPGAAAPAAELYRAGVLGEFGGLGLPVADHMWRARNWGYKAMADAEELTTQYEKLLQRTYELRDKNGLAAAVYTQLTDVEIEANGLLTYDRAVIKPDIERVAAANRGDFSKVPPAPLVKTVVPTAEEGAQGWQYTFARPADAWFQPDFDSKWWKTGAAGFGVRGTPGAIVNTEWNTADIWLRREFVIDDKQRPTHLRVHHDEDCAVYLNGALVWTTSGYTTSYEDVKLSAEALAAIKPGKNIIAVHCRQTRGGQYIDVGLLAAE